MLSPDSPEQLGEFGSTLLAFLTAMELPDKIILAVKRVDFHPAKVFTLTQLRRHAMLLVVRIYLLTASLCLLLRNDINIFRLSWFQRFKGGTGLMLVTLMVLLA